MTPMIWLIILVLMVIIEAMTYGLTTIWFAGGALTAAVACYLGADVMLQLVLFFAVSLILLFVTRPLAVRYMKKDMPKTNVNSLIGRTAIVTEEIDNLAQKGKVKLYDVEWMARTKEDGVIVPSGAVVEIKEVHGVVLTVA